MHEPFSTCPRCGFSPCRCDDNRQPEYRDLFSRPLLWALAILLPLVILVQIYKWIERGGH